VLFGQGVAGAGKHPQIDIECGGGALPARTLANGAAFEQAQHHRTAEIVSTTVAVVTLRRSREVACASARASARMSATLGVPPGTDSPTAAGTYTMSLTAWCARSGEARLAEEDDVADVTIHAGAETALAVAAGYVPLADAVSGRRAVVRGGVRNARRLLATLGRQQ